MADQRELSPQAREDLIEIWEYIAQFSEEAADKLIESIYQKAALLARSPYMGAARPAWSKRYRTVTVNHVKCRSFIGQF